MSFRLLVFFVLCTTTSWAAKPPPLGVDDTPPPPASRSGKPPPLGEGGQALAPIPPGRTPEGRPESSGTGFIVGDGRILTNRHVVDGCARVVARNAQGARQAAQVQATDPRRDLALLAVQPGFGPALPFRQSPPVQRGERVVTYGFPLSGVLSSGPTLTSGDISALAGLRDNPLNLQISAPVQPGNSGGPLLDAQGNVMGVVVSKLNAARIAEITGGDIPQNVNFAVKGDEALAFLREQGAAPRLASSEGPEKRPAEIGAIAHPSTVFLQCFK